MKSTRAPAMVLAVTTGLAGLGIGAIVAPVAASAATSGGTTVSQRLTAIKNALAGLVKDGTLTQAQADKVATTLDSKLPERQFGGHGMRMGAGLDEAASIIGISEAELRTQLQSGKTLAEVAKAEGMSESTLVNKLVAAAKTRLADAVKAGRLTQAQADQMTTDLQERITDMVTRSGPMGGRMHHRFGGQGMGGMGSLDGGTPPVAPSTAPTSSSSSSSSSA